MADVAVATDTAEVAGWPGRSYRVGQTMSHLNQQQVNFQNG